MQDRVGWISPGGLGDLCRRLDVPPAEAYGVATFYAMFSLEPSDRAHGARVRRPRLPAAAPARLLDAVEAECGQPTARCRAARCGSPSPCLGLCERAPAALVIEAGDPAGEAVDRSGDRRRRRRSRCGADGIERCAAENRRRRSRAAGRDGSSAGRSSLLRRVGVVDPPSLDDYRAHGGYARAARGGRARARRRDPRGRPSRASSGAAAPRSRPAASGQPSPASRSRPHYLVCNADESEPGTFKDRVLMEGDPFALSRR